MHCLDFKAPVSGGLATRSEIVAHSLQKFLRMCPAFFRYYLTRRFLQKLLCSHVLEKIPGQHVEHMVNMFLKEFCGLHFAKHLKRIHVAAKDSDIMHNPLALVLREVSHEMAL